MFQKLITFPLVVGLGLSTVILLNSQKAAAGWGFKVVRGSLSCEQLFTGIGGPIADTSEVVCAIRITDILRKCTNPGGESDSAGGVPHQVDAEIVAVQLANTLPIIKKGKSFSDIEISEPMVAASLGDAIDPALVCPNANWTVQYQVTGLQAVGEVIQDTMSPPDCNVEDVTASQSCLENINNSDCTQLKCARLNPCVAPAGTTLTSTDFSYECTCEEYVEGGVLQSTCPKNQLE